MDTFVAADSDYIKAIEAVGTQLPKALENARAVSSINLESDDLTNAVLLRLRSFYLTQDDIKRELNKHKATAAADFFVETIVFFLKIVLETKDSSLQVASEKPVGGTRAAKRPDISIWRNDELVAVIECKTQLGYSRSNWCADFEKRVQQFGCTHPNANLFLLVLTGSNWFGFDDGDLRVGKQFFVILDKKTTPREFELHNSKKVVVHRIEQLIEQILVVLWQK